MRIFIHKPVYDRTKEIAKALGQTVSQFIEISLVKNLGMEGIPLDENEIFGEEETPHSEIRVVKR